MTLCIRRYYGYTYNYDYFCTNHIKDVATLCYSEYNNEDNARGNYPLTDKYGIWLEYEKLITNDDMLSSCVYVKSLQVWKCWIRNAPYSRIVDGISLDTIEEFSKKNIGFNHLSLSGTTDYPHRVFSACLGKGDTVKCIPGWPAEGIVYPGEEIIDIKSAPLAEAHVVLFKSGKVAFIGDQIFGASIFNEFAKEHGGFKSIFIPSSGDYKNYTICGHAKDGSFYCNKPGNGAFYVDQPGIKVLEKFTLVGVSNRYMCGLVMNSDKIKCWQLWNQKSDSPDFTFTYPSRSNPIVIAPIFFNRERAISLPGSSFHVFVLTDDNKYWVNDKELFPTHLFSRLKFDDGQTN